MNPSMELKLEGQREGLRSAFENLELMDSAKA
jgi:hypothetical protein